MSREYHGNDKGKIMKIKVFVQSEALDDINVLEIEDSFNHKALQDACKAILPVAVNKEEFHLTLEDDDDDNSLENLKQIPEGAGLQLHRLKNITVQVRYAGRDVNRTFKPSTTIARIKKWAAKELGVAPSDAAELMLQISGTNDRPDTDIHLGTLVKTPAKSICFDLVPSPRVNG